jgi:hypothetical protein
MLAPRHQDPRPIAGSEQVVDHTACPRQCLIPRRLYRDPEAQLSFIAPDSPAATASMSFDRRTPRSARTARPSRRELAVFVRQNCLPSVPPEEATLAAESWETSVVRRWRCSRARQGAGGRVTPKPAVFVRPNALLSRSAERRFPPLTRAREALGNACRSDARRGNTRGGDTLSKTRASRAVSPAGRRPARRRRTSAARMSPPGRAR